MTLRPHKSPQGGVVFTFGCLGILLWLGLWIAGIVVAIHFLAKWW